VQQLTLFHLRRLLTLHLPLARRKKLCPLLCQPPAPRLPMPRQLRG
jgi:hypothetical protein